jgi:hypothetical protein
LMLWWSESSLTMRCPPFASRYCWLVDIDVVQHRPFGMDEEHGLRGLQIHEDPESRRVLLGLSGLPIGGAGLPVAARAGPHSDSDFRPPFVCANADLPPVGCDALYPAAGAAPFELGDDRGRRALVDLRRA